MNKSRELKQEFWLKVGDRVEHVKEPNQGGVVVQIDDNLISTYGVTTCLVKWDDGDINDIQWTNRLVKIDD